MSDVRVYPVNTGEADVSEGLDVWLNPTESTRTVPIITYLVEGVRGVDGPVLVDTGLADSDRATELMGLGDHRTADWDLLASLREIGYDPPEVEHLIFTHLHYEHVAPAYIRAFENATIYVQQRELEHAAVPAGGKNLPIGGDGLFYDRRDVELLCSELWDRVEVWNGDVEFAPGMRCVLFADTHTPGHQAVYLETDAGTVILTGDLIRSVELNIERQYPPAIFYDLRSMQAALSRLQRDGDVYLPTHDYDVMAQERYP